MKYLLLLALFIQGFYVSAQNLIPNPSFENAEDCPFGISDIQAAANWFSPTNTTPDYYNNCNNATNGVVGVPTNSLGYQPAHTGNAYAGFLLPQWHTGGGDAHIWCEYLSTVLTQQLIAGHKYYVSFYVNHANAVNYIEQQYNVVATDKIGVLFTDTAINAYLPPLNPGQALNLQPDFTSQPGWFITDTANWVKIQGFYTASGGEQYITIGRFHSPNVLQDSITYQMMYAYDSVNTVDNEAYYYIDDVCVTDLATPITSSKDTTGYCNQVFTLTGHAGGNSFNWSTGDTTASINANAPGTYWVATLGECVYYVDTFHIRALPIVSSGMLSPCRNEQNGEAWVAPMPGDTGTYTYTWVNALGATVQTQTVKDAGDTLTGVDSGSYQIFISGANDCNTVVNVTVLPAAYQASFTVDTVACEMAPVQFRNTSTGLSSWYWNFGDGDTSTADSPTHTYNHQGNYNVVMIGANATPCYDTAYVHIKVDTTSNISFTESTKSICEGRAVLFYPSYPKGNITELLWSFGDNDSDVNNWHPQHAYDTAGTMIVTLTGRFLNCPTTSYSDTIQINPFPVVNIGKDTALCPGQSAITLYNLVTQSQPMNYYSEWSTGDTTASISIDTAGVYWLKVTTDKGCATNDTVLVKPDCYINIPNAFTPNGDGINDYFFPRQFLSDGLATFHMQIFSRWGQLIFETTSTDGRGWDGRFNGVMQPEGVFIYLIEVSFINGTIQKYQGNVTLLK